MLDLTVIFSRPDGPVTQYIHYRANYTTGIKSQYSIEVASYPGHFIKWSG